MDAVEPSVLPDLSRDPVPAILASVEGLGVPALLQSAAGDRKGRILLQPAVAERRAAA
jgi:hypothetical protein